MKKNEIIQTKFSEFNVMKLEVSYRKKFGKFASVGKLNNTLLNNLRIKEEMLRETENTFI